MRRRLQRAYYIGQRKISLYRAEGVVTKPEAEEEISCDKGTSDACAVRAIVWNSRRWTQLTRAVAHDHYSPLVMRLRLRFNPIPSQLFDNVKLYI